MQRLSFIDKLSIFYLFEVFWLPLNTRPFIYATFLSYTLSCHFGQLIKQQLVD